MKKVTKIFIFTLFLYTLHTLNTPHLFPQLVSDFKVNDDSGNLPQFNSRIDTDSSGNFVIVWEDKRIPGVSHIFGQRYNQNSLALGKNFMIDSSSDTSLRPSLCVFKNGSFVVCWYYTYIKARIFDSEGNPISNYLIVSDSSSVANPTVDCDVSGGFIISWQQYDSKSRPVVLFQRYDKLGNRLGGNTKVTPFVNMYEQEETSIIIRKDMSFIIAWTDNREGSFNRSKSGTVNDVYMQMFDSNSNPIGTNKRVNDSTFNIGSFNTTTITTDSMKKFAIGYNFYDAFQNESSSLVKFYNSIGQPMGSTVTISLNSAIRNISRQEDGSMIVAYNQSFGVNSYPFFKRYDSIGNQIGDAFLLTPVALTYGVYYDCAKLFKSKIISTMNDERKGNRDVYCNIRAFKNPDSTVNILQTSNKVPVEYKLYQNYPNPFNPETIITFDVLKSEKISLQLFDITGKKVRTLFSENFSPGQYRYIFNNAQQGLASGGYIYALIFNNITLSKKMILIK